MPWLFLIGAAAAGSIAYRVGWPAWTSYRSREARDLNAERYLAWRGRGSPPGGRTVHEGPTGAERRAMYLGAALAVVALACLLAFFLSS